MIRIRKSADRGQADHGWLQTSHTFSFADYYDPSQMNFSVLRVINEDQIAPESGFGTHGHKDMEIITYVVSGALSHKDSMGHATTILPGEVQRLSAGTGIKHSEFNESNQVNTHLLQIWFLPEISGIRPSYEQKSYKKAFLNNNFVLVASKSGEEGSVSINQDLKMYVGKSITSGHISFEPIGHRNIWIQVIHGTLELNGQMATAGDGIAVTEINLLNLRWDAEIEFILFDLP